MSKNIFCDNDCVYSMDGLCILGEVVMESDDNKTSCQSYERKELRDE